MGRWSLYPMEENSQEGPLKGAGTFRGVGDTCLGEDWGLSRPKDVLVYPSATMIQCYISDPEAKLGGYRPLLQKLSERSIARVKEALPIDNVEVVLYVNPRNTIPEVGVAGISPCGALALIALDPSNPNFHGAIEEELPATIAHELHHCLRWQGVGFGETLLEVLVTEGLARDFERAFRGNRLPSYQPLFRDELSTLWEKAREELDSSAFSYQDWFFGSKDRGIPRFLGYALGLWLVDTYKARTGHSGTALLDVQAKEFRLGHHGQGFITPR